MRRVVKSVVSPEFRNSLESLSPNIQNQARRAYELWRSDPGHPSLAFHQLKPKNVLSAPVGLHYRAICVEVEPGVYVWDWIGSHSDYDKLVDSL
ncbi:MAG TPA: hypothetical protein VK934_13165 [Fimbriimonas sp.]|nr:hypothetical protein [Fimbriimonas sp.]